MPYCEIDSLRRPWYCFTPGRWLPALRRWIMGVRADRQKRSPKTPARHHEICLASSLWPMRGFALPADKDRRVRIDVQLLTPAGV
jgi:hypothetical protein